EPPGIEPPWEGGPTGQKPLPLEPVGFIKKAPPKGDKGLAHGKAQTDGPAGGAKGVTEVERLPAKKNEIDAAIDRGVPVLKKNINNGRPPAVGDDQRLGGAGLVGLTLLASGVPAAVARG